MRIQLKELDNLIKGLMIENRNYIVCMCRPKGRTARGEPGAAAPVARSRREIVSGFLSTLGVILYYYLIMLLSIVVVLNIF